jgi:hypothetical protein
MRRTITGESQEAPRKLSRNETHDLSMIIKERTKVLKAHVEEEATKCIADFERHISQIYSWDQDDVWKRATEEAMAEVAKAQEKIEQRCKTLGIPKDLSPRLQLSWEGRGQMKTEQRRSELRRTAKAEVEAMKASAVVKIEKQSLDLRTQVVAMGLLTPEANMFLDSLAPVEDAMHAIDFAQIETKMLEEKRRNASTVRRLGYGGLYD